MKVICHLIYNLSIYRIILDGYVVSGKKAIEITSSNTKERESHYESLFDFNQIKNSDFVIN